MELPTLDKDVKRGAKGKKVRLIQEWLHLRGIRLAIDSDFGPATDAAVREFRPPLVRIRGAAKWDPVTHRCPVVRRSL